MKFDAAQLTLYAVTDRGTRSFEQLCEQVEHALKGGVTCVQLREKDLSEDALIAEATVLTALCHRYGVPLLVDDNWQAAMISGADGVHVGQEDTSVAEIRAAAGPDFIIGATAKTVEQAKTAEREGADYLGVGAVFPSPTKPNAVRITEEQLKTICSSVSIPAVAIGGIELHHVAALRGRGIRGIAVISALFSAPDIQTAAKELKAAVLSLTET